MRPRRHFGQIPFWISSGHLQDSFSPSSTALQGVASCLLLLCWRFIS